MRLRSGLASTLVFISLIGCGRDVVISPAEPIATRLTLTPTTATIDTAGTLQLQSAVAWSDGSSRSADIAMVATGGVVSNNVYRAGGVAGQFQVIATCVCGVADTTVVTVVAQQAAVAATASLTVTVAGLPVGTTAQLLLTGPNAFTRTVLATTTLDSLTPGAYAVQANPVVVGANSYAPTPITQSVSLSADDKQNVAITYARVVVFGAVLAHPRVWMSSDRVAKLKTQAAANTVRWQRVKNAADAQLARGSGYVSGDENLLPDICATYLGTGDVRYAQRAGVILTAYAVEAHGLQEDSGYDFRFLMPLVTMGLDWCYDGLTVGQRHQAATWLMNRADWVWPETNASRAGAWAVTDPANNYWWGFMMTGPAALAAAGDDTLSGTVSGSDRPTYHQHLALNHWSGAAAALFAGTAAGGAWTEGTNYDSSWRVGEFADAFFTAGQPVATPWLASSLLYRFHSSVPGFGYKIPFGDQARVSTADMYAYDRDAALDMLSAAGASGAVAANVQEWLTLVGQTPTSESSASAILGTELIHYDPAASAAPDLSGVSKDYYAPGAGQFIYRTSWTDPNATLWAFESGPITEGHSADDANGLRIWQGSFWISSDANIYSHSGIEQDTRDYNNLTIGTTGQSHNAGNTGQVLATQVSDQLVVVRGQAQGAYGSAGSRPVRDYVRTVAYLPAQDAFIVVDNATAVDPSQAKTWRWHMQGQPTINGNTFRLDNPKGDAHCFGTVLNPAAVLGTGSYTLGIGAAPSSYAVTVTLTGNATDVVVTVLQCGLTMATPAAPAAQLTAASATVTVGGVTVIVPLDATQAVHLQ